MNLKPLGDRVLIKPLDAATDEKVGSLYIPQTAAEKPHQGEVVAVGEGRYSDEGKHIKMTVKAGDKVLYGKYSGTEVKLSNVEHLIMRETDILAVVAE